jgi:hypothetical protein
MKKKWVTKDINVRKTGMEDITVFSQRAIPACVAHTVATIMQMEWKRQTGKLINFSPRFLDILAWSEEFGINEGVRPETVFQIASEIGCCTENLLPNDTTLPIEIYRDRGLITEEMMDEAFKYRMNQ